MKVYTITYDIYTQNESVLVVSSDRIEQLVLDIDPTVCTLTERESLQEPRDKVLPLAINTSTKPTATYPLYLPISPHRHHTKTFVTKNLCDVICCQLNCYLEM